MHTEQQVSDRMPVTDQEKIGQNDFAELKCKHHHTLLFLRQLLHTKKKCRQMIPVETLRAGFRIF